MPGPPGRCNDERVEWLTSFANRDGVWKTEAQAWAARLSLLLKFQQPFDGQTNWPCRVVVETQPNRHAD
jgi:hypothetical protein